MWINPEVNNLTLSINMSISHSYLPRFLVILLFLTTTCLTFTEGCSRGNECRTGKDCSGRVTCMLGICVALEAGQQKEVVVPDETFAEEKVVIDGGTANEVVIEPTVEMPPQNNCPSCWLFLVEDTRQGSANVITSQTVQSKTGDYYVALRYTGTLKIENKTYSAKGTDTLLIKVNEKGKLEWAQSFGAKDALIYVNAIRLDASESSLFIVGNYKGSLLLGTNLLTSTGTTVDSFVARFDLKKQEFTWLTQIAGNNDNPTVTMALDSKNNSHVLVYSLGKLTFRPAGTIKEVPGQSNNFIIRFDPTGKPTRYVAPKIIHGLIARVAIDQKSDRLYLVGHFKESMTWDDTNTYATGASDKVHHLFLAELDTSYSLKWLKHYETADVDQTEFFPNGLLVTDKHILVASSWRGKTAFKSPHTLTAVDQSTDTIDMFAAKFDRQGQVLKTRQFGDKKADYGFDIIKDPKGGFYLGGTYISDAFNTKQTGLKHAKPAVGSDPVVVHLDDQFNPTWLQSVPGGDPKSAYSDREALERIFVDNQGNVIMAGRFLPPAQFGNKKVTLHSASSNGYFLWQIGPRP